MKTGLSLSAMATEFETLGGQILHLPRTEWRELALAA